MKIAIISPHSPAFFRKLKRTWEASGYPVEEITSLSTDDYHNKTGVLSQAKIRLQIYVLFTLSLLMTLPRRNLQRQEIWIIVNPPIFLPFLARKLARTKQVHVVNLLYDLYPEALIQSRKIRCNSRIAKKIEELTIDNLQHCSATVFFGERIKHYIEKRYGGARRHTIIPIGADASPFKNAPPNPLEEGAPVRIMYSGSMGYMHDYETLLKVLHHELPHNIEILFHASGVRYTHFRKKIIDTKDELRLLPELRGPLEENLWHRKMISAHIGLVTMAIGAENVCMPSKTYSAMAAGQAILAICPRDSDLADTILKHDSGWIIEPGHDRELKATLEEIATDARSLHRKRVNAHTAAHQYYDMEVVAAEWIKLFEDLCSGKGRDYDVPAGAGRPN
jgi:glycosyltransferase involved in cell wall biosynthesis